MANYSKLFGSLIGGAVGLMAAFGSTNGGRIHDALQIDGRLDVTGVVRVISGARQTAPHSTGYNLLPKVLINQLAGREPAYAH